MGEVVRAPPTVAVVRLLDDMSDTVRPLGGWRVSTMSHACGRLICVQHLQGHAEL